MRTPLVSVVIPTYNRLPLLREAVESVRGQTHPEWELIVVDDGSTDGTAEFLSGLCAEDGRVRAVSGPHSGAIGRLRNAGVAASRGEYVAFLDSDDLWAPEKLERQLAALRSSPEARAAHTATRLLDERGVDITAELRSDRGAPRSGWLAPDLLARRAGVLMPSLLVERALLEELGGFDESLHFAEDLDLALRMTTAAQVVGLPERLVAVRHHAGQSTRSAGRPTSEYVVRVLEKYGRANPAPEVRRECRRQIAFYEARIAFQWAVRRRPGEAAHAALRSLRAQPSGAELRGIVREWWVGRRSRSTSPQHESREQPAPRKRTS